MAHALAERLAIPYYDKKILEDAVLKSGMREEVMKKAEEQLPNALLHSIYYEEYAEKSDCIIVGRCADAILKEYQEYAVKSIFVTAPMEHRIATTMKKDNLEEKAAAALIRKSDKKRSAYYAYHTGRDWGKASDYDFCVNTATTGMQTLVDLCKKFIGEWDRKTIKQENRGCEIPCSLVFYVGTIKAENPN